MAERKLKRWTGRTLRRGGELGGGCQRDRLRRVQTTTFGKRGHSSDAPFRKISFVLSFKNKLCKKKKKREKKIN